MKLKIEVKKFKDLRLPTKENFHAQINFDNHFH